MLSSPVRATRWLYLRQLVRLLLGCHRQPISASLSSHGPLTLENWVVRYQGGLPLTAATESVRLLAALDDLRALEHAMPSAPQGDLVNVAGMLGLKIQKAQCGKARSSKRREFVDYLVERGQELQRQLRNVGNEVSDGTDDEQDEIDSGSEDEKVGIGPQEIVDGEPGTPSPVPRSSTRSQVQPSPIPVTPTTRPQRTVRTQRSVHDSMLHLDQDELE